MKRNLLVMAGLALAMIAMADVKFHPLQNKTYVDCPKLVAVGDKFSVEYLFSSGRESEEINRNDIRIKLSPAESNAELISGPEISMTTSTTWDKLFGKLIDTSIKWRFTFRAVADGMFEVPNFTLISDSDTLKPKPINKKIRFVSTDCFDDGDIKVSKNHKVNNQTDTTRTIVRLELDKMSVQVGDTLICSMILLCSAPCINQLILEKPLTVKDCEILPMQYYDESSKETIDHTTFIKCTIGKYKIIPSRKGKYKITPIKVKGEKELMYNMVDKFYGKDSKYVPFENESNALKFKVK